MYGWSAFPKRAKGLYLNISEKLTFAGNSFQGDTLEIEGIFEIF